MSESLHFAAHRLQELALGFMAVVYAIRIAWYLRFRAGGDRQAPAAGPGRPPVRGVLYSWAIIGMPWAMESTRRRPFLWIQFVLFHLGVTAAIALSFIIPYGPGLLEGRGPVLFLQVLIGAALAVGVVRMVRRVGDRYMRAISSPDDYFSLVLLTVWFFFAVLAAPNDPARGEWRLLGFFILTAFFLIYVPFSKISHYLYYPFTRFYLGRTLTHRGVYPIRRVAEGR
jgi:nitrate reductase gamma subunit